VRRGGAELCHGRGGKSDRKHAARFLAAPLAKELEVRELPGPEKVLMFVRRLEGRRDERISEVKNRSGDEEHAPERGEIGGAGDVFVHAHQAFGQASGIRGPLRESVGSGPVASRVQRVAARTRVNAAAAAARRGRCACRS
jgi:hypothetical protein